LPRRVAGTSGPPPTGANFRPTKHSTTRGALGSRSPGGFPSTPQSTFNGGNAPGEGGQLARSRKSGPQIDHQFRISTWTGRPLKGIDAGTGLAGPAERRGNPAKRKRSLKINGDQGGAEPGNGTHRGIADRGKRDSATSGRAKGSPCAHGGCQATPRAVAHDPDCRRASPENTPDNSAAPPQETGHKYPGQAHNTEGH